jgi:sensor histidine kinase YesM
LNTSQSYIAKGLPLRVFAHLIFWIFFVSLPFLLRQPDTPPQLVRMGPPPDWTVVVAYLLNIPLFYLNSNILLPKVLKTKGVWVYMFWLILTIAVLLANNLIFKRFVLVPLGYHARITVFTLFPIILLYAASTIYRLISDYINEERLRKELENENLKSELSFLRSQISPHFMFNVLNTIVALARKKSDMVEPVTIQLSELMRYMLYESDERKVSIAKEIEYLRSYIELQKLRFGVYLNINFTISDKAQKGRTIEPMLLIPFVENAFKHGTGLAKNPVINVEIDLNDDSFHFKVSNSLNTDKQESKDGSSGIGLANVKRRLQLLYPNAHQLSINQDHEMFVVELTIY